MKMNKRFFVFFICFLLLFLSFAKSESLAACSPSVKLAGYPDTFTSIQAAYDYASSPAGRNLSSFKLLIAGGLFSEDLVLNGGDVVLDGGYDCSFLTKSATSNVYGTITIGSGSLTYEANTGAMAVTSSTQCEFDRDGDGYSSIGSCSGTADDCNDNNASVYPGAPEICDGLDNDCYGQVDEGLVPVDADNDGYYAVDTCGSGLDDCNDNNANINPGVLDIPYDGIDQDCSGADLAFAEGNDCETCHAPAEDMRFLHNSSSLATDTTCVLCHAVPVSNILSGHYGKTVRTAGNNMSAGTTINCYSCHDPDRFNHSGGTALGNGSNTVWGKVAVQKVYIENLSCDSCHENRATGHATATAHDKRVIESGCGDCHTSDNSALGSAGFGTLSSAADVDALHGVASAMHCVLCHDYSGTRLEAGDVRQTIQQGLDGTPVSCTSCHTAQRTNHYEGFTHSEEVGPNDLSFDAPGQPCGNCHDVAIWAQIDNIEHNVDTNGAGSCATCHNSQRQEVIDALALGATPTYCLDCHSDKALTRHIDHVELGYVTTGPATCLTCHAPGAANNGTVIDAHLNNCLHCHTDTTTLDLQPGVPVGGGDCAICHTGTWEAEHTPAADHTVLVTVGTTSCADCHDDILVSAAPETHDACASCHDADGGLVGSAVGTSFAISGDCATCHTGTWETEHTPELSHTALVTVGTSSCADCHDDTLISAAAETHNACISCHDVDGGLIGSAIGTTFAVGGDCATCHTGTWEALHPTTAYDHGGIVTVGATSCADCHDDTLISAAAETHNACASCHDTATGALVGSAIGQSGSGDCATCHTGTWEALHPTTAFDHTGIVTVGATNCADCHDDTMISAAAETHNACASCHDAATGALIGSAIGQTGSGDCATCHTTAFGTIHTTYVHTVELAAGDLSFDPPGQPCSNCHAVTTWAEIDGTEHNVPTNGADSCSTCHNSPRQEVIDAITLGADPTVCLDCHSGKLLNVHGSADHVALGYVTVAAPCLPCHDPGPGANVTMTVTHLENCNLCHATLPALLPGIPAGGGDCATCHTDTWEVEHTPAIDHTALVTVGATGCAPCHDDTLVSAAAETHNACSSCHDTDGGLIGSAIGTTFAVGGDCATCHAGTWEVEHTPAVSHTALVTVGATGCADCHDDTLISAAAETHNACASCHDVDGGLISSAFGTTFAGGGDCATCHTGTWDAMHPTTAYDHSGLVTVGATSCTDCHDDTLISAAAETHNACTSCHDAGSGDLIGSAIGQTGLGDCTTCHAGTWEAEHPNENDHSAIVIVGSTSCASCHDDTLISAAADTHNACASCHDANTGALVGSAVGTSFAVGGDCATCHTGTWEAEHPNENDHSAIVIVGSTSCADCHDDTLISAAADTHNACASCHDANTGVLIGSAVGTSFAVGGDCATCHTGTWEAEHPNENDHSAIVIVGSTSCADCHDDTLISAATDTHNACASCHDSATGALIGSAEGTSFAVGGDCATCHTGTWEAEHPNENDHSAIVIVGSTSCATCHDDTLISAAAETHNACGSCHNANTGALIGSAIGTSFATGGDCVTCHGSNWEPSHTGYIHTVALGSGDLTDGVSCGDCHVVATWTEIDGTEHNVPTNGASSCSTCHNSPRQEVIDAIALGANPTNCLPCHSGKDTTHGSIDHVALGYVTEGPASCVTCHDSGAGTDATVTVAHNGDCALCHTTVPALQPGLVAGDCAACHGSTWEPLHPTTTTDHTPIVTVGSTGCADCHDDTLNSAAGDTHNACVSCHDATTGALIGSAVGTSIATGGDCITCHTSTWEADHPTTAFDHSALVTVGATSCASCHDDTLISAAAETHNACISCHDAATGVLIGSAIGRSGSGDCATCHTGTWEAEHPTTAFDHSALVTVGTSSCADCHDDTLISASPETHNACASCHDAGTGALIGSAIGRSGSGDCATCHTGTWEAEHPNENDHSAIVIVGSTSCADCHDDTLISAAAETHNACASCHDPATGALIGSAIGTSFAVGGDCATCHTGTWEAEHPNENDHSAIVIVGSTSCADCHDDTLISAAAETHNACASCHDPATGALIGSAIGTSFAVGGDCATCHTGTWEADHPTTAFDHSALVTVGATSCASCHDDTLISASPETHNACASCHDAGTGALIGSAIGRSGSGDCTTCHTGTWEAEHPNENDHSAIVIVGSTSCADCHDDTLISAAADTHNACASCHDPATGALIGSAIGTSFAVGGDCATCHTGTWEAEHPNENDHSAIVIVGSTSCADCHDDTLISAAAETHNACASCHDPATGALIGSAIGTSFAVGGDCATCHTGTWEVEHPTTAFDHSALVTVGATSCASCHDDTLISASPETHNACASCHDAGTGALIGSAIGRSGSGDCATCHTGTWEAEHPNENDHSAIVIVGSTSCADCHDDILISAAADTHNACASCHDPATGALIGSAIGTSFAVGGDCATCHTGTWEAEHPNENDHSAIVIVGSTSCADCHDDTLISASPETHNACASCHDPATGALIGSAIGTSFAVGGDCATCHTGTWEAEHPNENDHSAIVIVGSTSCADCHDDTLISAAADTHNACASCHDPATGALIGSAIGTSFAVGGDCATCHTGTWEAEHPNENDHSAIVIVGSTSCADCHDDTLISAAADTHNACASCHDPATGALIGSAIGTSFAVGGDCATCHTGTWEAEHPNENDHSAIVIVGSTSCADCHDDTLISAAADTHNACASCHDPATGALIGSAIGTSFAVGGDCATCHTGTWEAEHPNENDHSAIVIVGSTSCADCHDDTLISAAADTHNACASCHDPATGALIGSAVGTSFAVGGDCATCHTGTWEADHPTTAFDHSALVTVGATSCASCHDDTLISASPETHNACISCHDAGTGALIGSAIGQSGSGDCATCHGGGFDAEHATYAHTVALGAADLSSGISCGNCHAVADWAEIDTKHNVDTNGAGSCATCHNSPRQEVTDAITLGANPTNCLPCHSNEAIAHADHVAAGYVTVGGVQDVYGTTCASCHDPGGASDATVAVTHGGDCALCHTTVPNLQPGIPAGGGDCVACHSTGEHTLWSRYSAQSCGTAACHDMNGGPGNTMHDLHNPVGGWPDRDSVTSDMTFPYASNPEMWQTNWPLNPLCETCHTTFDDDSSGAGCNPCHAFMDGNKKGDLHNNHSGKNGFADGKCSACH